MKAETIVTAITTGDFDNYQDALQALMFIYAPDMSIPRPEIIKAEAILKEHYTGEGKYTAAAI